MPVIKENQAAPLLKNAIILDMGDVSRQAQQIITAARGKAQRLVDDAKHRSDQQAIAARDKASEAGRTEGHAQGLEQGRVEGRAQAMAEASGQFQQLQQTWLEVVQHWQQQRDWLETEGRQAVLDLALRMAEKLVYRVIEVDQTVIVDEVAAALTYVLRPSDVTVHICPEDRPVLEEALPQLMAELGNLRSIRIKDDPEISRGGCELQFGQGAVDATIETQLRRIVELILPAEQATDGPDLADEQLGETEEADE